MAAKLKCPKCGKMEVMKLGATYLCMECEGRFSEADFTAKPQTKNTTSNITPDYNADEQSGYVGNVYGKPQQAQATSTPKPASTPKPTPAPKSTPKPAPAPKPTSAPKKVTSGTLTVNGITYTMTSQGGIIKSVNKSSIPSRYTVKSSFTHDGITYKVYEIGNNVFEKCNLTSVVIENGIKKIGDHSFYNNKITSVTFPSSLVEISNHAFSINELTHVTIPASVTKMGYSVFFINPKNLVIQLSVKSIPSGWHKDWSSRDLGLFDVTLKHKNIKFA